ncbi:MAG: hypothetical protein ABF747_04835 [Bifidobacterium sp.]|uniref:Rubrerythrin n=2 Tax=Bifidobacterium TaxID=1678 RepID=A0AB39UAA4_9BIFI
MTHSDILDSDMACSDLADSNTTAAQSPTGSSAANFAKRFFSYDHSDGSFVLKYVQPGLVGLIDGTVSTLAPVFASAIFSGPHAAFIVGMATALGAGVSMGWSEALSDNGEKTGRGSSIVRGAITGAATTIGGTFHTLPFLIPNLHLSLLVAFIVVAIELVVIAWVRNKFLHVPMKNSLLVVTLGGLIVLAIGVALGAS